MTQSPLTKLASHERTRREILLRCDRLPPLPQVVTDVLALLDQDDTEPHQLAELLGRDPALVARMLGTVNSPLYGLSRTISSIVDTVVVLGYRGLRSLVLASGTSKFLRQDSGCYGYDRDGLWQHSLAVATGCREIGNHLGISAEREELFVSGLLHDIGKMVLAPYVREKGLVLELAAPLIESERSIMGIDHDEAGALIAAKWRLGDVVEAALAHLHADSQPEAVVQTVTVVRLANAFAKELGIGLSGAPEPGVSERDLAPLGISVHDWQAMRGDLEATIRVATSSLATVGPDHD